VSGQLLSSKVVIVEEEPTVRGIPSIPTSGAGAVGITERGPIGEAVLCSSFDEYEAKFGGFTPDSDLALAVMGFFENGGSQLWVVRTAHYTNIADPSTITAVRAAGFLVPVSGGKPLKKRRNGLGSNRISAALRMAATTIQRSKSALGASYRRIARNKGAAVAVFATARKLATLIYRMLRYGQDYVDLGEAAYESQFAARRLASLKEAARSLGYALLETHTHSVLAPS